MIYFLDDIRVGDIIEYAYSCVGENTVYSSHLTISLGFQKDSTVEKLYRKLLVNPDVAFVAYKALKQNKIALNKK